VTTNGYTHLTKDDLGWIEIYYEQGLKPYKIAEKIGRSNQRVGHQMPLLVGVKRIVFVQCQRFVFDLKTAHCLT
jgi:hypothetical protein